MPLPEQHGVAGGNGLTVHGPFIGGGLQTSKLHESPTRYQGKENQGLGAAQVEKGPRATLYRAGTCGSTYLSFFEVPKGDCDICMVYNGSESGLNECMWVPRFIRPTIHTHHSLPILPELYAWLLTLFQRLALLLGQPRGNFRKETPENGQNL
eukprot:scaffold38130_cov63-Attheya_sp.AAC.2